MAQLGALEQEIMDVVWSRNEPLTVRDVMETLNNRGPRRRAYNTVMSVMSRLADKELLLRKRTGRSFLYWSDGGPQEAARRQVSQQVEILIDEYGGDATVDGFFAAIGTDARLVRRARSRLGKSTTSIDEVTA